MLGISVVGLLSKCTSLKNQEVDESWNKFRAGKDKFKAVEEEIPLRILKKLTNLAEATV